MFANLEPSTNMIFIFNLYKFKLEMDEGILA